MNIIFSAHAERRAVERGISVQEIHDTVRNPSGSFQASNGHTHFYKTFGGKQLEVIAAPRGGDWVIVTAYYVEP